MVRCFLASLKMWSRSTCALSDCENIWTGSEALPRDGASTDSARRFRDAATSGSVGMGCAAWVDEDATLVAGMAGSVALVLDVDSTAVSCPRAAIIAFLTLPSSFTAVRKAQHCGSILFLRRCSLVYKFLSFLRSAVAVRSPAASIFLG